MKTETTKINPYGDYVYTTELHLHTSPVSKCAHVSAREAIKLYGENGCNSVVITNHLNPLWLEGNPECRAEEYLSDYREALEAGREFGVTVILGLEIRFTENNNDYLVYGVEPGDIKDMIPYIGKGIHAFYRDMSNGRRLILQAHPFRTNMVLAELCDIDGVETMNMHPGHNSRVGVAAKYARDNGLFVSGGSDCHQACDAALCLLRSRKPLTDSYGVADLLRSKDFIFDISGHLVYPYGI